MTSKIFFSAKICLLKFKNRYTRARCEILSKLTIKTPEWHHSHEVKVEIAIRNQIFLTQEWKLPIVWNSEILKMSGRVIPFYLSKNRWLTKVDAVVCHIHYSPRFSLTVSSHFHFHHRCNICEKADNILLCLGAWHKLMKMCKAFN